MFRIVLGDETMGLYDGDRLITAATRLTFADVLEGCGIPCEIWEIDLDLYNDPTKLPQSFKDLNLEIAEQLQ